MRVLHLIDLQRPSQAEADACEASLEARGTRHRILGFGDHAAMTRAYARGLPVDGAAPPVGPWPEASFRRLRRLISDRDGRDATRPWADVVQCWSPRLLGLARLASGHRTPPRIGALLRPPTVPARPPAADGLEFRRLAFGLQFATLFALDRHSRAAWAPAASARRGGALLEQNIRLLPTPSVPRRGSTPDRRAEIREDLGIEPTDMVIALLADPPSSGDLARFMFLLGLLFTTGKPVVGIAPHGAAQTRRGARFVRMHGRRWGLRLTDATLDDVLAAADLSVIDAADPHGPDESGISAGGATIARALALGVPVVAPNHPLALEHLSPLADLALARDATPAGLADRLLRLAELPERRQHYLALAAPLAQARTGGFAAELADLWREATNTPVVRAGLPLPTSLEPRAWAGSAA